MPIHTEHDGPVTTIILDRPDRRNAVDREHAEALADAFRAFEADDEARVAVLWGKNGTFCAGADLKAIAEGRPNRVEPDGDGPMGPTRMMLDKPVVAAIAGHAVAGGLELACWCDLRVVEEDATLGVFCRRWGVPLIDGGTVRLPRLIGVSQAMDLILTGRSVDGQEAMDMGLANRLAPPGQARHVAEQLAEHIAQFPQECMLNDRRSAYESLDRDVESAMEREFELGVESLEADAVEGATRFAEGAGRHGEFEPAEEDERDDESED